MVKRRGNGEGSFRQRSNGTWQASLMIGYTADGKKNMRYFSGKTRAEVQKKLYQYLEDKEDGLCLDKEYTLSEWLDVFMEVHRHNIKPVTYDNYKYTVRIITSHPLGDSRISDIKPLHVERFLRELVDAGRSRSYVSKCRAMLHIALEKATGNDLIRRNPVRYAEIPRLEDSKNQECFTAQEIYTLLRELPNNRDSNAIRLMLTSGIRTQELLALQPRHIASDGSYIVIEQAVSMVKGTPVISTPKSRSGYRTIPLPQHMWPVALDLKNTLSDYIWTGTDPHKPANPSTFRAVYRKTIEAVPGIGYKSPHATRRGYVSLLQAKHVDMATIQSLVGHNSLGMTQHYLTTHLSIQREAAAVIDAFFTDDMKDKTIEQKGGM